MSVNVVLAPLFRDIWDKGYGKKEATRRKGLRNKTLEIDLRQMSTRISNRMLAYPDELNTDIFKGFVPS